ncbi:MAG TPA: nucleotidyltransferase family protein [Candidatus Sulfopaludibacter sp.]|nr:nucleotidyltransferase family protein [Candidatus Sulfopaludibacter sp.]
MKPAAVILAAGESSRMGSPKPLLPYEGETFLDRLIGLLTPRCHPVIVVLGAASETILAGLARPATFVINPNYAEGQTSSMQCGLHAVPADVPSVLFTLADHPAVAPETLDAVLANSDARVCVPRYHGKRGHPILFSRALIDEFLALHPDAAARDVVHAHADETIFLDLDDPGIVTDIDNPDAYRSLLEGGV